MKLLLHILVVEKQGNAVLIRTAAWLSVDLVVEFLVECTVPEPSPRLVVGGRSIADADAVVGVDPLGGLHDAKRTSSANLLPIMHEGLVSSEESYLHLAISAWISGP